MWAPPGLHPPFQFASLGLGLPQISALARADGALQDRGGSLLRNLRDILFGVSRTILLQLRQEVAVLVFVTRGGAAVRARRA